MQMERQQIDQAARKRHIDMPPLEVPGLNYFVPLLEEMRKEGAVIIIKWDGERHVNPYTAVVSGKILGGEFLRCDAKTMEKALSKVILSYIDLVW